MSYGDEATAFKRSHPTGWRSHYTTAAPMIVVVTGSVVLVNQNHGLFARFGTEKCLCALYLVCPPVCLSVIS